MNLTSAVKSASLFIHDTVYDIIVFVNLHIRIFYCCIFICFLF